MTKGIADHTVIFVVTAEQTRQVVQGFSEWKPDGYLLKPLNINNILPRMVASYRKKQRHKEIEDIYVKQGFAAAKNALNQDAGKSYYGDLSIQILIWDQQHDKLHHHYKKLIEQGDNLARLSYCQWLLAENKTELAKEYIEPLLSHKRFRLDALSISSNIALLTGNLDHAYGLLEQMNMITAENPQRLLMQFNLAAILGQLTKMQTCVERYQRLTRYISWLNIDGQFNALRCLLSQFEDLHNEEQGKSLRKFEVNYLRMRSNILKNPRAHHIQTIKEVLDARFALSKGMQEDAISIINQYSDYNAYVKLPFYCQLDIVHLYRKLGKPLPNFIKNLDSGEHSKNLLLQNTLMYTDSFQQRLAAQMRKIRAIEQRGLHMQAVSLCIESIDRFGISLELAKILIKGFTKAIPMDLSPEDLRQYYQLSKHTLTQNKDQLADKDLHLKYCRYIETTVNFLNQEAS